MSRYTVLEWNALKFKDNSKNGEKISNSQLEKQEESRSIEPTHAKCLAAAVEKLPISEQVPGGVLDYHRNKISARCVVGVVQTGMCSLEILPKIDNIGEKGKISKIRKMLIEMIKISYNIKIDVGAVTSMEWQDKTILEILIGIFANKLVDAVRRGLSQKYTEYEDDLPVLKGALDITRQFTINITDPSVLACQFDEFSYDNPLNQVMKAVVFRLSKISSNSKNLKILGELSLAFADVSLLEPQNIKWNLISTDRTNNRWKELVALAKFFLRQQYQTTTQSNSSNPIDGYALLFDMNRLFEEYIGRMVQKASLNLRKTGNFGEIRVLLQKSGEHCLKDRNTNRKKFFTRPDILVKIDGRVVLVIDTKWKRIESKGLRVWKNVSSGDFYQMIAYGQIYESPRVTLIYPHIKELGDSGYLLGVGDIRKIVGNSNEYEGQLEIYSFDLADSDKEQKNLENLITNKLECAPINVRSG